MESPVNVENELHGEWMIVSHKKRNPSVGKAGSKKDYVTNKTPRFFGIDNHVGINSQGNIHVGSASQGIVHDKGKKLVSSPKVQGPSMAVSENKGWVKPKKRRHDQGANQLTFTPTSTSRAPHYFWMLWELILHLA